MFISLALPSISLADTSYGKVTDISKSDSVKSGTGDSLDVEITGNETSNVTVDYGKNKGITLQYLSSTDGRPDNVAWLGIHVTVPSSITSSNARYTINGGSEENLPSDGDYYFGITVDKLIAATKAGKPITYVLVFKWSGDLTQTVTVNIYPKSITLLDKSTNDSKNLWTITDYEKYRVQDDVPKTGVTYPAALILCFLTLLLGGTYHLILSKTKK